MNLPTEDFSGSLNVFLFNPCVLLLLDRRFYDVETGFRAHSGWVPKKRSKYPSSSPFPSLNLILFARLSQSEQFTKEKVRVALLDDFDTPSALAALIELVRFSLCVCVCVFSSLCLSMSLSLS